MKKMYGIQTGGISAYKPLHTYLMSYQMASLYLDELKAYFDTHAYTVHTQTNMDHPTSISFHSIRFINARAFSARVYPCAYVCVASELRHTHKIQLINGFGTLDYPPLSFRYIQVREKGVSLEIRMPLLGRWHFNSQHTFIVMFQNFRFMIFMIIKQTLLFYFQYSLFTLPPYDMLKQKRCTLIGWIDNDSSCNIHEFIEKTTQVFLTFIH